MNSLYTHRLDTTLIWWKLNIYTCTLFIMTTCSQALWTHCQQRYYSTTYSSSGLCTKPDCRDCLICVVKFKKERECTNIQLGHLPDQWAHGIVYNAKVHVYKTKENLTLSKTKEPSYLFTKRLSDHLAIAAYVFHHMQNLPLIDGIHIFTLLYTYTDVQHTICTICKMIISMLHYIKCCMYEHRLP